VNSGTPEGKAVPASLDVCCVTVSKRNISDMEHV